MKNLFKLLALAAMVLYAPLAVAQERQAPVQLSPEAKQGVELLAKSFGIDTPKAAQPAGVNEKTAVDVADRALTMVEQGSRYMEEQIKKIAPEVWRIMVRQQYAKAIGDPALSLAWMLAAILAHFFLAKMWVIPALTEKPDDDAERVSRVIIVAIIPTFIGLWAFIAFVWNVGDSVKLLFNPEYYAFKDLIRAVLAR